MFAVATMANGATSGVLDFLVSLTSTPIPPIPPGFPPLPVTVTKNIPNAMPFLVSNGSFTANRLGVGWGNLQWEMRGTIDSAKIQGEMRIHNEFIAPWTEPWYQEDTGWVPFILVK